jgi:hypothetical protein
MTISFSVHAQQQMQLRGATEAEVTEVVKYGVKESALRGRFKARLTFDFNKESPVNGKTYRLKIVEVIWAEEQQQVVVVTVLVYYADQETSS